MVQVLPFRGLRYGPQHTGAEVLAPPYDVIDAEGQRDLIARSPHNVVRLILGEPSDGPNWHAAAAARMRAWQEEGVLQRDEQPRLYGYQQRFRDADGVARVRTGLLGRVRLRDWGEGIHRHEHTRVGPRADRLRLTRAVQANLSPVFGLYRDPAGDIAHRLTPPEQPAVDATVNGVREAFWPIEDPRATEAISAALAERDVVIADGHHRYETALAYAEERRAAEGHPAGPRPYDYVLMYLAAAEDPGLLVLPTHRVVSGVDAFDGRALLRRLAADFLVEAVNGHGTLREALAASSNGAAALGLCLGAGGEHVLRLREPAAAARAALPGQEAIAHLDVTVLQNLVLAPHLGISPAQLATGEHVRYTISEGEACRAVQAGDAQAAFLLNPPSVEEIWEAAAGGATMPQKSTYFYPKLLTGLVIHPLSA